MGHFEINGSGFSPTGIQQWAEDKTSAKHSYRFSIKWWNELDRRDSETWRKHDKSTNAQSCWLSKLCVNNNNNNNEDGDVTMMIIINIAAY